MALTADEMKALYTKGAKGKEDRWESGLIDKTPLTAVNASVKKRFKEFADDPPADKWYTKWYNAMKG